MCINFIGDIVLILKIILKKTQVTITSNINNISKKFLKFIIITLLTILNINNLQTKIQIIKLKTYINI